MKIGNRCFKRLDERKTWRESLADCQLDQNGGSLASIHSVQEWTVLSELLSTNDTWIGLNDIDNEGFYVWADGSPFSYVNWISALKKFSSMRISHSCVAATKDSWKTANCLGKKRSLCVIPAFSGRKAPLHHFL